MSNPNRPGVKGFIDHRVYCDMTMTKEEYERFAHKHEIKPNTKRQKGGAIQSKSWKF